MSVATWHAALTISAMVGFIGMLRWVYKGDAHARFEATARLALEEDSQHDGSHE
jgi:cbb3-type cytochrome oxidase subunit 3